MKAIRKLFWTKALAVIAGLAFLNMSFFLAEVSVLNFEKGELMENIASLILNTGFEEERDGESAPENNAKEIHLLVQQVQIHYASSLLISTQVIGTVVDHYLHADHSFTFSPPPDFF